MDTEEATRLRDGLAQQRKLYSVLEKLTAEQCDVLVRGDTTEIARLAEAKDGELLRIDAIDAEIGELKQRWPESKDTLQDPLRSEIEAEIDELSGALEKLLSLERSAADRYQQMLDDRRNELKRAEGRRQVARAYGNVAPPRRPEKPPETEPSSREG